MSLSSVLTMLSNSLRVHGFWGTIQRLFRAPYTIVVSRKKRKRIFSSVDPKDIFREIYATNYWGSSESVSGTGSTALYTENLRLELPNLIAKYQIKSVFDAPCGDFNWMQSVIADLNVEYTGADIVPDLIALNRSRHETPSVRFSISNIITDPFPSVDLWICRDCLIHFSYRDILFTLENFASSGIKYMLTTSHINQVGFKNRDIQTGDARLIDLFSEPFLFPSDYIEAIDDWQRPDTPRRMIMFSAAQIKSALPKMRRSVIPGTTV